MSFLNPRDNPNALVGIFALVMLAILAGPNMLPVILNNVAPFVDEGVPCSRLRIGEDRAFNQSLIGRDVSLGFDSPLALTLRLSPLPLDGVGDWTVTIVVQNTTLGTVPIALVSDQLDTSAQPGGVGIGLVAGGTQVQPASNLNAVGTSYDEESIRLLGPRQRCVFRVNIPFAQIPSQFSIPGIPVRAFYRNDNRGAITLPPNADRPPVFPDQGLWIGVVESEPVTIN